MFRKFVTILCFATLLVGMAEPAAAKRVALVIGNDDYHEVAKLKKAANDAQSMANVLTEIGFDVIHAKNVARREMNRQLQLFLSRLEAGDEALFYYAGHGIEIDGRNYLLPTDIPNAEPGKEEFVKAESVPVDQILGSIRDRGTRISILVLDACRNNPFPSKGTRSLGGARGLARMPAAEGTFILYSAGVGQTALDRLSDEDANPNSVFTRSLIPLMKRPGFSLTKTARQLRRDVQKLAATISHDQRPAYYDEVTGDFFFTGKSNKPAVSSTAATAVDNDPAATAWNGVKDTESPAILEAFIKAFPSGLYTTFAKARLAELQSRTQTAALPATPDDAKDAPDAHPYDGVWKVRVSSMSGCNNNKSRAFTVEVINGVVHAPRHRYPKKGLVSRNGKFDIKVLDKKGRLRARQTGVLKGNSGTGRLRGAKPRCRGLLTLELLSAG